MINTQMNNNEGFFYIRRRHYCVLLLLCFFSFLEAQIYISDSTVVKVENGAILYNAPLVKITKKNDAKIYVLNGAFIKNTSEVSNADLVYLDKKQEEPHNYVEKHTKKAKQEIQKKDFVAEDNKFFFTSHQSEAIFQSFGDSGSQSIVPSQNFPTEKAVLNEKSSILIDTRYITNLFSYQISFHNISFNSNLSIRPPPALFI